jgi:exonuclease VII small subunit
MKKTVLLTALLLYSFISHSRMHVKVDPKSTLTVAYEENFFKYLNNTLNNLNNRLLDLEETFDNYEKALKNNNKIPKN